MRRHRASQSSRSAARTMFCALLPLVGACTFDGSGLMQPRSLQLDSGSLVDAAAPSLSTNDSSPDDQLLADSTLDNRTAQDLHCDAGIATDDARGDAQNDAPPDAALPVDAEGDLSIVTDASSSAAPVPLTPGDLAEAFGAARVDCVLADGSLSGELIGIVDSTAVQIATAEATLAGAPIAITSWVSGTPAALVIWDPNGCDRENWVSAGLLIRGAAVDAQGALLLAPETDETDLNMMNVTSAGAFQADWAGSPDDLSGQHELALPVQTAKQLIISLAAAGD
jgi:hypothetical protein